MSQNEHESIHNSDILFLYDAKLCNPNGDPDDENKPRMDYETETNLVSDVRLKRYVRDYLEDLGNAIFVARVDERTVDATQRLAYWTGKRLQQDPNTIKEGEDILKKAEDGTIKAEGFEKYVNSDDILKAFIDVRLFGATMPIKGGDKKGQSFTFTGPVQFNWGYSLNRVSIVESSTISSTFAGRTKEKQEEHGTFGKDYRLYYSLIAFHGIISGKRADHTKLSENDIALLQESIINSIPLQATRSKIGQYPRLFVRVEYADNESFIGDLRRFVACDRKEGLRDVAELKLDTSKLVEQLKIHSSRIHMIHCWQDDALKSDLKALLEADAELKPRVRCLKVGKPAGERKASIEQSGDIAGGTSN